MAANKARNLGLCGIMQVRRALRSLEALEFGTQQVSRGQELHDSASIVIACLLPLFVNVFLRQAIASQLSMTWLFDVSFIARILPSSIPIRTDCTLELPKQSNAACSRAGDMAARSPLTPV